MHKKLGEKVTSTFIKNMLPVLIVSNIIIYFFEILSIFIGIIESLYYGLYGLELLIFGIFSTIYGTRILSYVQATGKTARVKKI